MVFLSTDWKIGDNFFAKAIIKCSILWYTKSDGFILELLERSRNVSVKI